MVGYVTARYITLGYITAGYITAVYIRARYTMAYWKRKRPYLDTGETRITFDYDYYVLKLSARSTTRIPLAVSNHIMLYIYIVYIHIYIYIYIRRGGSLGACRVELIKAQPLNLTPGRGLPLPLHTHAIGSDTRNYVRGSKCQSKC